MSRITDDQLQTYLDELAECGIKLDACKAAGISYAVTSARRKSDPDFAAAEELAEQEAAEVLVREARRRAIDGVESTRYTKDGTQYFETRYSDTLLIFLLKGLRPDTYADRNKSELSAPGGAPLLQPENTTEAAARMIAILDAARRRRTADDDDLMA